MEKENHDNDGTFFNQHTDLNMSNSDVENEDDGPVSKTPDRPTGNKKETGACIKEDTQEKKDGPLECPVCLQSCVYPVQLPCGHIFCFLCVKGVANRNRRCALCRQQIPADFFCQPNLVENECLENPATYDDGYGWFYGGVNGWWQYDDRTSGEMEVHHKAGHTSCELLIAGYVYIIDLANMVQIRRNDRTKKRRIKRDLVTLPGCKGIAGLKVVTEGTDSDRPGADGHESRTTIPILSRSSRAPASDNLSLSPSTPYNTPHTPQTPSESPPQNGPTEQDLSVQLERLRLDNVPRAVSMRGGSSGSSHGYNTPDIVNNPHDDAARLHHVSASLAQYQADRGDENGVIDEDDLYPRQYSSSNQDKSKST